MNDQNNIQPENNSEEIPKHTALNPEYMMTAAFHQDFLLQDDSVYAGESVNEHVLMESANEFLAEKELGQIKNNS